MNAPSDVRDRGGNRWGGLVSRSLRGASIRRKLALASVVATSLALLAACALFLGIEISRQRGVMVDTLGTFGEIFAYNLSATLDFRSPEDATAVLSALRGHPRVRGAVLYGAQGEPFARYVRESEQLVLPASPPQDGVAFGPNRLTLTRGVFAESERLGTLYMDQDLEDFRGSLQTTIGTFLGMIGLALVVARQVSARLLRTISEPIEDLAEVAHRVSQTQDYGLRARRHDDDEIGVLTDSLNAMLDRIERDTDLEAQRRQLEDEVAQRKEMNRQLLLEKERAEAATRAKSEFLANMSHEIRTPLNGALGMTELLLATPLSAEQQRMAETAHRSGTSLLELINDVLDFSKIESGKLELEQTPFSLRGTTEDVAVTVAAMIQSKPVELVCDIDPALPARLLGDPVRVRQVLLNLAGNAAKFTERGEIVLAVRVLSDAGERVRVRLSVSDTGIGIPEHARGRIFDAFVQADGSTTRRFGGTGLGLSITRELIALMGGELGFSSSVGVGSLFGCELELETVQASPAEPLPDLSDVRVLIVAREGTARGVWADQLRAWSAPLDLASDATHAVAMLRDAARRRTPYRAVLLDRALEGDPLGLVRSIQSDPRLQSARIVLLTSVAQELACGIETGACVPLYKPVRMHELLGALRWIQDPVAHPGVSALAEQDGPSLFEGLRVLVAEDNPVNQMVMAGMLQLHGCSVAFAADGGEVVDAVLQSRPDLVLMDCQMPVMSGLEAARAIRQRERGRRTPIVAVTANARRSDEQECRDAGMDGFLTKPFSRSQLADVLARLLGAQAAAPGARSAAVASATSDALDLQALRRLGDPAVTRRIIDTYLSHTTGLLAKMREAVGQSDARAVASAAHSLKSSSATIGARRVAETCKRLEAAGRDGSLKGAAELLTALELAQSAAREALLHERGVLGGEAQDPGSGAA